MLHGVCILGELLPSFSSAPYVPGLAGFAAHGSFRAGMSRVDMLRLGT